MKLMKVLPLMLVASLTTCSNNQEKGYYSSNFYSFDTFVNIKIKHEYKELAENALGRMQEICEDLDKNFDAYKQRDITCLYDLNKTNDQIQIGKDLYTLLAVAKDNQEKAKYFNPLVGSLSNKWKEALEKNTVLSDEVIKEELKKIEKSSLELSSESGQYFAKRTGEALIDVGAIAKGYALDRLQKNLPAYVPTNDYLVDAGTSSILLGTSARQRQGVEEGKYVIKIKELSKETYLHLNNCYISTSGTSEQKTIIDGVTYSHIVDPFTGSAKSLYDAVIVISDFNNEFNGTIGDMLSTSFMMSSLDEIKAVEASSKVKVVVIKDDSVLYKSESIELY